MKKNAIVSLILLFCAFTNLTAQYRYPNKEDQAKAKSLKSMYAEEDRICAVKSTENYSFETSSPDKNESPLVIAHLEKENEIIALTDNYNTEFAEFYDSFSNIFRFKVWNKIEKSYKSADNYGDAYVADYAYNRNGFFCDDARYKSIKYTFSTLGDMMKYSFQKNYSDVKYLTTVFFNSHYPVDEKVITFDIPDWLTIDLKEFNFEGFDIVKTKTVNAGKKITTYTYTMKHCAAIKQDDNAPVPAKNWPHLVIVAKKYSVKGVSYNGFNSVDDLYAWYSKLIGKVKNDEGELKSVLTKITAGKTSDLDKIKSIYYWVQDNIRYIAFEEGIAGFQPADAHMVFKNKYGDCKGMANLLTTLLKMSGYDARLTWIGTKDIPYDYSLPSLCVDNHMICTLVLKDSLYFLDGTESYISFGDYADRIQNRQALIQNGKSYLLKKVPSFGKEHNKLFCKRTVTMNNELLKGTTDITYNGESKTTILRSYNEMASSSREDALSGFLTHHDKNYSISNIATSDLLNREIPVNFKYNFELENRVTSADNEVYVSLEIDHPYSGLQIKDDRKQDFVFNEKVFNSCETEFTVPAGYKVKYIPSAVTELQTDYSLTCEYKQIGNKVTYKRSISFDNGLIKKSEMKEFAAFLKKMKNAYDDQLILAKK